MTGCSEPVSKAVEENELRAVLRVRLYREKKFYGPGIHHLLQLTEELGSLSAACQRMGMSYSKGRRIIGNMEEELGATVLESGQGGKTGGYSRLTPQARDMMTRYGAFLEEAEAAVQALFHRHFPPSTL